MEFYIKKSGKDLGSFSEEKINEMLQSGELSLKDKFFSKGTKKWLPLSKMPGVQGGNAGHDSSSSSGKLMPVLVLVVILACAGLFMSGIISTGDTAKDLQRVATQKKECVALVVLSGWGEPQPMATAFAVGPNVFATNSHVTEPVAKAMSGGASCFLVINGNPQKKYRVMKALTHPRYNDANVGPNGDSPAAPAYDVGLLYIEGSVDDYFTLAAETELKNLKSGYPIGFLGFPMEGLSSGGVDHNNPVATMQTGIVTSVSDFWLGNAEYSRRLLVSHNLPATGGASGSPIFNDKGEVIAILNAGNINFGVDIMTKSLHRIPSAAQVNFGMRIDQVNFLLNQ